MRTRNGHENKQKNRKFKHDLFYSEHKLHYLCTQKKILVKKWKVTRTNT